MTVPARDDGTHTDGTGAAPSGAAPVGAPASGGARRREVRRHTVLATRIFAPEPAAASFRLEALARALGSPDPAAPDERHAVTVLTTWARRSERERARDADEDLRGARVRVERAPVLRDRTGYVRGYLPYLSFDVPLLVRLLAVPRPDVVVAEPPPTTGAMVRVACAVRRLPYVYYAADVWSDATAGDGSVPGLVTRLLAAVEGWAMRGARGVVAVSPDVAERVEALVAGGATRRRARHPEVLVVRNGGDTDVFRPGLPRPQGAPGRYLVYAGTTSAWQGADVFVRALADVRETVPDAELVILGQGSDFETLRALADELVPGVVHLHPVVPAPEAAAWIGHAAAALVSVRPGVGYDLALPTKTFAAAACGTPVVFAGPGPAVPLVREHELGQAVAYDVEEVATAMIAALEAPASGERAAGLAAWAREHASVAHVGATVAAHVRRWRDGRAPGAPGEDGRS
ncbi:glycosyltransferase [Sanguibacter massiliensis]|uniref:glycosyltransferase n=1 Tax=Sanguibacter massiliensis TaxID=1973217 RepID=UPI001F5DEE37|nr:glycosyltransferase [Sanguibacter massiliensis]